MMLSRLARRSVSPLAARAAPPGPRGMSTLAKYGLDDWKVQIPLGIFVAIPIIHNEVLILSEETQLVGCFALFCGAFYNIANSSVAEMLDARGAQILAQHNAVEEKAIAAAREIKAAHEAQIEILSHVSALVAAREAAEVELVEAKAAEFKHKVRESLVKKLDSMIAKEDQVALLVSSRLVEEAASAVEGELDKSEVTDALLTEAIAVIEEGKQPVLVGNMFKAFFHNKAKDAKEKAGSTKDLTPDQVAELKEELDALIKRDAIEVHVDVPTKVAL